MKSSLTVEAPASSANLGAGFDVFAIALEEPRDRLVIKRTESVNVVVRGIKVSPRKNVVAAVARATMEGEGVKGGVSIVVTKGVPIGAGLGSSAASSAATVFGLDRLFSLRIPRSKMIGYAGVGEEVASGAPHLDNVAASLLGGFVIISKSGGFRTIRPPPDLALCLVTPKVRLPNQKTRYARALLPREVPLNEFVSAVASASLMVHGFAHGSVQQIGSSMSRGYVDSKRIVMIPGFDKVRKAALKAGAAGVCISGAGPTVLAAARPDLSEEILGAMVEAFDREGVKSRGFVTKAGKGCRVIG